MDSLKIQGIFPSSISDISYANQESQFGGQSIAHHKNQQKSPDYHIKIKGPDNTHIFKHQTQQKPITSLFQPLTSINNNPIIPCSSQTLPIAHIPQQYNQTTTGYPLHRQSFSQQEILKAFNVIDINKDNMITEEDLIFILDYMNQQYTIQEVKQMISMISVDGLHVGFDQFKKLGRGDIMPLAKFKIGGKNNKQKEHIMKNIQEQGMFQQDPKFMIQNLKKNTISLDKFEQLKKGIKIYNYSKTSTLSTDKLYKIIPLLSKTQYVLRKNQFHSIVTTTIQNIIQNYNQNQPKMFDLQKIAHMLQITVKQVKQLYSNRNQINSLVAVMQAIAYSNQNMFKKLQMSLDIINSKDTIYIEELVHILQVLRGQDQSISKKIKAICKNKGLDFEKQIKKNLAYQIVLQFSTKLFGFD